MEPKKVQPWEGGEESQRIWQSTCKTNVCACKQKCMEFKCSCERIPGTQHPMGGSQKVLICRHRLDLQIYQKQHRKVSIFVSLLPWDYWFQVSFYQLGSLLPTSVLLESPRESPKAAPHPRNCILSSAWVKHKVYFRWPSLSFHSSSKVFFSHHESSCCGLENDPISSLVDWF